MKVVFKIAYVDSLLHEHGVMRVEMDYGVGGLYDFGAKAIERAFIKHDREAGGDGSEQFACLSFMKDGVSGGASFVVRETAPHGESILLAGVVEEIEVT